MHVVDIPFLSVVFGIVSPMLGTGKALTDCQMPTFILLLTVLLLKSQRKHKDRHVSPSETKTYSQLTTLINISAP